MVDHHPNTVASDTFILGELFMSSTNTDWNPAVDKQAAARCWRDGQKKRCFTYRFLATGTVEEKIFQRQLSKEGLQSVVDDKEQVNALSTKDLKNLFKLRSDTPSDTHDKLRCERCEIIQDDAEMEAVKVLPKKLAACKNLLALLLQEEEAQFFVQPMIAQDHGIPNEEYEKKVKQPIDFGYIRKKLEQSLQPEKGESEKVLEKTAKKSKQLPTAVYKSVSLFSKDVNRVFSNCLKVWSPSADPVAEAAHKLQVWWFEKWKDLVPELMMMKANDDKPDNAVQIDDANCDMPAAAAIMNERGDNYQEQMGMPDEENMRSWSHHYTTDTLDDPVFRAAMRGFDSVSFVFGLEVTWSLIQQKNQEEDEKQAMLELQAIQEMNEEEDDDEAEEMSKNASAVAAGVAMDDEETNCGEEDEDSDTTSVGMMDDAKVTSISGGDEVESTQQSEESDSDPEVTEAATRNSDADLQVCDLTPVTVQEGGVEIFTINTASPPLGEKENDEPGFTTTWSCSGCSFLNDCAIKRCEICKSRCPTPMKKQRT